MTAASLVRCSYCGETVPVNEAFEPFVGAVRCRNIAACDDRLTRKFDPSILPAEERPARPAVAPPGTVCRACQAATSGLYQRSPGAWYCTDSDACQQASMSSWRDGSPDQMIAAAGGHLRLPASAPVEVPPNRTELDPEAAYAYEVYRAQVRAARG